MKPCPADKSPVWQQGVLSPTVNTQPVLSPSSPNPQHTYNAAPTTPGPISDSPCCHRHTYTHWFDLIIQQVSKLTFLTHLVFIWLPRLSVGDTSRTSSNVSLHVYFVKRTQVWGAKASLRTATTFLRSAALPLPLTVPVSDSVLFSCLSGHVVLAWLPDWLGGRQLFSASVCLCRCRTLRTRRPVAPHPPSFWGAFRNSLPLHY